MIRSRDFVCVGIVLLGLLVNVYPRRLGPIDIRWDAAQYYVLGTALASGHGYRILSEPGDIEEVQYPPGAPALIALHQAILGTSEPAIVGRWLKLSWFLMFTALSLLTYALLRKIASPWLACIGALLVVFNITIFFHSAQCSADLPYTLVGCAFIMTARDRTSKRAGLAAALLAVAGYFIRSVGIVLFAAWVIDGLLRRYYREAALRTVLAVGCIFVWNAHIYRVEHSDAYRHTAYSYQTAGYQFYNVSYGRNMAYLDPFRPELGIASPLQMVERFGRNALLVPQVIGESVTVPVWTFATDGLHRRYPRFPILPPVLFAIALALIGLFTAAGLAMLFWSGERLIAVYVLLTAAAVAATPWPDQIHRYMAATTPLLIYAFLFTILRITSGGRAVVVVCAILGLQCLMYLMVLHTYSMPMVVKTAGLRDVVVRHVFFDQVSLGLEYGLQWIAAHSNPNDVISMTSPQVGFVRTGRKSVMPPLEPDHARANDLLKQASVRYLLLERNQATYVWKYMWPVVSGYSSDWRLVFRSPGDHVLVYERHAAS